MKLAQNFLKKNNQKKEIKIEKITIKNNKKINSNHTYNP